MISDVDVRDWDRTIISARQALDSLDDCARMDVGVESQSTPFLSSFIDKVEALVVSNDKQIAALFKAKS